MGFSSSSGRNVDLCVFTVFFFFFFNVKTFFITGKAYPKGLQRLDSQIHNREH
jgi:hypothetical protein